MQYVSLIPLVGIPEIDDLSAAKSETPAHFKNGYLEEQRKKGDSNSNERTCLKRVSSLVFRYL